jgi:hypothetical protein
MAVENVPVSFGPHDERLLDTDRGSFSILLLECGSHHQESRLNLDLSVSLNLVKETILVVP